MAIRFGRHRKSLSKKSARERDEAYAAQVQIVSYNLLKELGTDAHDIVILDEVHALRAPLSQQSKTVRAYFKAHPKVPALGLTATPIPTEVKQLWNLLDTFWPGEWGAKHPAGDVSWQFQHMYCERVENEYGVCYRGSRSPEALTALGKRLEPYIHRVTDKEVAPFLPPLHAAPLWLDEKQPLEAVARDWLELESGRGSTHLCLVAFNRETAWALAEAVGTKFVATGEFTAEQRDAVYEACRQAPRAILVATCEAIRESVDLTFNQAALVFQWRSSPAQALQLMGRFRRQSAKDLTIPVRIEYVVSPGEERRAELLLARIRDIQQVMAADSNAELLEEVFKSRDLTEEQTRKLMLSMFENFSPDWADWSDDEDAA